MDKVTLHPADEDDFHAAKDWLLHRFGGGPDSEWIVEQVLDFKWNYFDEDLTSWTPAEVGAILLDRFPAKSTIDFAERPEVIVRFAAFLRWLGSEGIMRAGDPEDLALFVETLAGPFMEAMADESKWGMAKRLFSQVMADGVDINDEAGVNAWMERFNAGSIAERDAILGPMPGAPMVFGSESGTRPTFPPVTLAPTEQLAAAAENSTWLRRVRDFVKFVGNGRALTGTGQLKLADGKELIDILRTSDRFDETIGDRVFRTQSCSELREVTLTFQLARAVGVVKVAKKQVKPTRKAKKPPDSLESWFELFQAMTIKLGMQTCRWSKRTDSFGWWAPELDRALPSMLAELYVERAPLWVDGLADTFGDMLERGYEFNSPYGLDMARHGSRHGLRDSLRLLEDHGAVLLIAQDDVPDAVPGDQAPDEPGDYESGDRDRVAILLSQMREEERRAAAETAWVAATELGMWGLNRLLAGVANAPVIGALADASASQLLSAAADMPTELANAEIENWVTKRIDEAPDLLVDALIQGGHATRGMALRALLRVGPLAADAIETLAADESAWPYAWVWRVDAMAGSTVDLPFDGDPANDSRVVAMLHAAMDVWGPVALDMWIKLVSGPAAPTDVLSRLWRVRVPETEAVLAAIGGASTDRICAKAARKALFRYRSVAE